MRIKDRLLDASGFSNLFPQTLKWLRVKIDDNESKVSTAVSTEIVKLRDLSVIKVYCQVAAWDSLRLLVEYSLENKTNFLSLT